MHQNDGWQLGLVTSSVPFFVLLNQIVLLDLNIYSKEINASK